jgi:hypothetical protein
MPELQFFLKSRLYGWLILCLCRFYRHSKGVWLCLVVLLGIEPKRHHPWPPFLVLFVFLGQRCRHFLGCLLLFWWKIEDGTAFVYFFAVARGTIGGLWTILQSPYLQ